MRDPRGGFFIAFLLSLCYSLEHMTGRLTPKQAADVIKYYHDAENGSYRQRGFPDKVSLGLAALHAAQAKHSLLLNGPPALTLDEMTEGLQYQQDQAKPTPADGGEELELSWWQQRHLDALMDGSGLSHDEALRRVS